jgi:two-component system response regulator
MNNQRFNILMAEDNEHDIIAARRAWKKNKIANPLYIVNDGEACLDYLHQHGAFSEPGSAPPPGILLLDLNMPKMDGLTVLQRIRADKMLRRLPIIVLTTSQLEEDRAKSYELGANAYIKKPIGFESFSDAVKIINHFWELAELPE